MGKRISRSSQNCQAGLGQALRSQTRILSPYTVPFYSGELQALFQMNN